MITLNEDGFERGFYRFSGISELECPNGWAPDWKRATDEDRDGINVRPEIKPKYQTPEVRPGTGKWSVSIHTREATHQAVLLKQFSAEPGKYHTASVWSMGVTGLKGDCGHGMRIGIDPTGKVNAWGESVLWSDWYSQYMKDDWQDRKWEDLAVTALAQNQTITVFLWSSNDYPKDAFAHFDDFKLEVEGDGGGDGDSQPIGDLSDVIDRLNTIIVMHQETQLQVNILREGLNTIPKRGDTITL